MLNFSSGVLRRIKYAVPLIALFPVAFGISLAVGKLAPDQAEPAFSEPPAARPATSRLALLIANADYPDANAPLSHPIKDARALADELRQSGFAVDVHENLGKDGMQRAFESFRTRLKPGSVALVYFGGFGIQAGRQSYMIPVDASIWKEADVRRDGINIESALAGVHGSGARVKLVILDASRRNPFERRFRGFSAGLSAIDAPLGTLLLSAAAPGKVADDRDGAHSLTISELLKEMNLPGVSAEAVFHHTRVGVSRASNGEQVPLVSSSLIDNFAFMPAAPRLAKAADATPSVPHLEKVEDGIGSQSTATTSAPVPVPPVVATRPEQTVASSRPQDEPAVQPAEAPEPVKQTTPQKALEEIKFRRRPFHEVGREIAREQPRIMFRRGGWYASRFHSRMRWRTASAYPHYPRRPLLGIGF